MRNELGGKLSYAELNAFADDLSHRMVELNASVSRKPDATEVAAELLELRTKLADNTGPAVSVRARCLPPAACFPAAAAAAAALDHCCLPMPKSVPR